MQPVMAYLSQFIQQFSLFSFVLLVTRNTFFFRQLLFRELNKFMWN